MEKQGGPNRAEGTFIDFRSFLSECDLFDLRHSGDPLSWRGVRYVHLVRCRLDRAISNSMWAELYPSARCEYLSYEGSDHKPIISYWDPTRKKGKGLFRYDRRLRDNEQVKKIIAECWIEAPHLSVDNRLSKVRGVLVKWSKEQRANSRVCIEKNKADLEIAMTSPINNDALIRAINENLSKAYKAEEDYWKQRSRILWLTLGEKNSSYFHAISRGRATKNKFSVLEDEEGKVVCTEEDIAAVISEYYHKMFTSQGEATATTKATVELGLQPKISEEVNERLIATPTAEEIRRAAFSIHADKAPGPDSFSVSFFQTNWPTVGPEIVKGLAKKHE